MKRDSRIPVRDGIDIGISIFDADNPRGVLVFNPAMGVPRSFYDDFANWVSTQGYRVITWNYRGTAGSGDPRTSDAHIHDWGEEDLDTLLGWYRRADITTLDLVPAQQGMQRIGHFGFFRTERGRGRLWPQLTRWLDKILPGLPSTSDKEARHVPADIRD